MVNSQNRTVLITGAGRGLGLSLAQQFLKDRWTVFPLVRKESDARKFDSYERRICMPIVSDISMDTVGKDIRSVCRSATIDVLINNAGIGGTGSTLMETMVEETLSLLNVHVLGALRVIQAILPQMKKDGLILNMSSRFGSITKISSGDLDDISCSYSYRIAKAAQNMLTQCMCREFKHADIKICAIHPGRLRTGAASIDADKTPEEAAEKLIDMLAQFEHGRFYSLFEGEMAW